MNAKRSAMPDVAPAAAAALRIATPETSLAPPPVTSRPEMSSGAIGIVSAMTFVACALSAMVLLGTQVGDAKLILAWTVAAAIGHLLSFRTATRRGEVTLGTTINLSMVVLLAPHVFLPALWLSRLVNQFFLKRPWYRALFNASQIVVASLLASWVYTELGGTHAIELTAAGMGHVAPAFIAAALAYYFVNMMSVAGVIAATSRQSMWSAWRENYGYATEFAGTGALILLVPVVVISHSHMGLAGLAMFLAPMAFLRDASMRYVELRRTQQALIGSERLAAKGEVAAEMAHEINNFLTIAHAELQMLLFKGADLKSGELRKRVGKSLAQLDNIAVLCEGLADFTRRDSNIRPTELNQLIESTVSFLRYQRRFETIKIELDLDPRVGVVRVDPAQIQQVVMNLMSNAANAIIESNAQKRVVSLWLRLDEQAGKLELGVSDTGPGVLESLRERIFEPGFSTRSEGRGFGLSTVHMVVTNHRGTVRVDSNSHGGALVRVTLLCGAIGIPTQSGPDASQSRRDFEKQMFAAGVVGQVPGSSQPATRVA